MAIMDAQQECLNPQRNFEPRAVMTIKSILRRGGLVILALLAITASDSAAPVPTCRNSGVLFVLEGGLYVEGPRSSANRIADNLENAHDLIWSKTCSHYALIASGALWIGKAQEAPQRLSFQGEVARLLWDPSGKYVAAEVSNVERISIEKDGAARGSKIFLVDANTLSSYSISTNSTDYLLGWSDDGGKLVFASDSHFQPSCDPAVTLPCANRDIAVWDLYSRSASTVISAPELNERKYDIGALVRWNTRQNILFAWQMTNWIGAQGEVISVDLHSRALLWKYSCQEVRALQGGRFGCFQKDWNQRLESAGFVPLILSAKGHLLRRLSLIATEPAWSIRGKYVAWITPENGKSQWTANFVSTEHVTTKSHKFPKRTSVVASNWISDDFFEVETLSETTSGQVVTLWRVDPTHGGAEIVFRSNLTARQPSVSVTSRATDSLKSPDRLMNQNPPIVLGRPFSYGFAP